LIKTFADEQTKSFWEAGKSRNWPPANVRPAAKRKLAMLDAAKQLQDLRTPPGNRLHGLERERKGQYAIAINDQFRISFVWKDGDAYDVEIVDYH
jgi:toxin HigB-1